MQSNQQQVQMQEVLQNLDDNTIYQCLEAIHTAPNESIRKNADQYLMSLEEHPQFSLILISIFEKAQVETIKLTSLMYLKNIIKRYWSQRSLVKKKECPFPEQNKTQIRQYFVTLLQNSNSRSIRKHIDACISLIIQNENPNCFPQIIEYIQSSLSALLQVLKQGNIDVLNNQETYNLLKTCKIVLRQFSKKPINNQQPNPVHQSNLELVFTIWEMVNNYTQQAINNQNINQFSLFTSISIAFDKMLCFSICSQSTETQFSEALTQIICQVVSKLSQILDLIGKVGDNEDLKELLFKQIKAITINTISIQIKLPLAFHAVLSTYMSIVEKLIYSFDQLEEENLLKCGLLAMYRILNQFTYYANPELYQKNIQKNKIMQYTQPQIQCSTAFYSFFTAEKIEQTLNYLIQKILPYNFQQMNELSKNDDIIEKDDENYMDDAVNEIDNSLYSITMCMTEQVLQRFAEKCLILLKGLMSQLQQSNFTNVSSDIQESIFSIMGLVPKVCKKNNINPNNLFDFVGLLKYLYNNQKQMNFAARRIPILVTRWIEYLPQNIQVEIAGIVSQIIYDHQEPYIRYECCMCLSEIIKTEANLDYSVMIDKIAPIIVQLFTCFEVANVLWRLISFLSNILKKCQAENQHQQLLLVLQNSQLNVILNTDSELLKGALADMFIDLIVFFPPSTPLQPIYKLAIQFIDNCLSKRNLEVQILKLWYFLSKEYCPLQQLDEPMKNLLFKYIPLLSQSDQDEEIIVKALSIIEEYILLEFVPLNSSEILDYIEKTYVIAKNFEAEDCIDECLNIKTQALNLLGTSILIMLNRQEQNILMSLERVMKLLIKDLSNTNIDKTNQSIPSYRAILQTIFNRFLIENFGAIIEFIKQCGMNIDAFMETWFMNMEFTESKNTSKINTIAVLTILPHISGQMFQKYFGYALKRMLPDIHTYLDLLAGNKTEKPQNTFAVRSRKDEKVASARKKALRQTQLYENVNLVQFFKTQIQVAFQNFNITPDSLSVLIDDQGRIEQFLNIMNSN
ncbi:hypothetical protein ABPG72_018565 [Tetrahymena utriculariae]